MKYAELGSSGIKVSRLGFGAMRLDQGEKDAVRVLRYAFERGINYFDSAYDYCDGKSEGYIGKALKQVREKVYYSSKNPVVWKKIRSRKAWREMLEDQLRRMRTDYIDFYHCVHSLSWKDYQELWLGKELWKEARRQRELGRIRFLYFSWHDSAENLLKVIRGGHFQGMTVQYNLIDQSNAEALALAKKKGMGTVVMGPVGGGRLAERENLKRIFAGVAAKSAPEAALRFVYSNPDVDMIISGMQSEKMVRQNIAALERFRPLSKNERRSLAGSAAKLSEMAKLYCTACGYCKPCPEKIDIPEALALLIRYRVDGQKEFARDQYGQWGRVGWLKSRARVDVCTACGACEKKCPQKIPIIKRLKEITKLLT